MSIKNLSYERYYFLSLNSQNDYFSISFIIMIILEYDYANDSLFNYRANLSKVKENLG
jgi:hypothetical protein